MLTKGHLQTLKQSDLNQLYALLRTTTDNKEALFLLENIGALPHGFDGLIFMRWLGSDNSDIRYWTVKNIGKTGDPDLVLLLYETATHDPDSFVRREAVSSIGRLRNPTTIPVLTQFLSDSDPKVVLQAIRGLLVFRSDPTVMSELEKLAEHPNETIQQVIRKARMNGHSASQEQPAHTSSPEFMRNVVVHGDVLETLTYVPDEAIHLTFTSPPYYNARDYSIYESYQAYLDFLTQVFCEVHRVTKEGRFLIVNTSPVIVPRVSRSHSSKRYPIPFDLHGRLVQTGWEFIDDIIWLKPETSVKNRNAGFLQHRKPLGYKPNPVTEYLMVYRKATDRLLDWNIREYDHENVQASKVQGDYETSNVWRIDPTFDRVHSAVFPAELCRRVIRYYSYIGDLIFDPFGGSGTLGKAARDMQRNFFLTEKEAKYVDRMRQILGENTLFEQNNIQFLTVDQFAAHSQESS
jgi:DNA modification methylase